MRDADQINREIRKLRIISSSPNFSEAIKKSAWDMMLTLQWVKTTPKTCTLTPSELTGLTMVQSTAIKKLEKRCG